MDPESNLIPLNITNFTIDSDCVGTKWIVAKEDQLARLIAIIAMGQAEQAEHIIEALIPAAPAFTTKDLKQEAIKKFTVQKPDQAPGKGYPRWQRDGLIFELISWIAAKQVAADRCYLKDPHISSTSHGLDGLMIELTEDSSEISKSTIFEDKCTETPRRMFRDNVIPGFLARHKNTRSAELIASAANLIKMSGASGEKAIRMAKKVMDNSCRQYRAGFALTQNFDNEKSQKALFKGYGKIANINQEQRIGASLIVEDELRDWFDSLADKIIDYIQNLNIEEA